MSGRRDRGRGRSRGRQSPATSAGRGPQASRGGGQGRGGGGGYNATPPASLSSSAAPLQQSRAESAAPLHHKVEQKLSLEASSSAPARSLQPEGPAVAANPPPVQPALPPASTRAIKHPRRPGFGTEGRKVIVKANHFLASVADRDLSHYDVTISPEVASKKVCREIINQLVATFKDSHLGERKLAYDGRKSCYSAGPLPFESKDFDVKLVDKDRQDRCRERKFKVSLKMASKPSLHHLQQFIQGRQLDLPQETLQLLDVVLRENPSKSYTVVGRSFFSPVLGDTGKLGNGLEYWKGFYQSLRPTQMGLSLNIDISARAFLHTTDVLTYISEHFHKDLTNVNWSDQDRIKVQKALRGVRVETNHAGLRRYKISGITTQSTQQLMFSKDDTGEQISVAQYFLERYDVPLRCPHLPAIQAGSDIKPLYLPMELCSIVAGQRYTRKLNETQVTAMLRATCQRPEVRENSISKMVECNNYNQNVNKEFGIQVRAELTPIEARVLTPPTLKYHDTGKRRLVAPSVGQWNMIDTKMVNGGNIEFWTCINFSRILNRNVGRFCDDLIEMCCSKGMVCSRQPLIPIRKADQGEIARALSAVEIDSTSKLKELKLSEKKLQLLIVILPDMSGSYGTIKRVCETELGIVSQCCLPGNISKPGKRYMQYMENVSLKINAKVGGRNCVLERALLRTMPCLRDHPTIIFGADVTHPQPGEDSSPSIAAVVASMDWPEVTKYRGLVSAQAHREEIIQDLYNQREDPNKGVIHGGMIREHLMSFYRSNNKLKPDRIIFYRDGVSEGQFSQVLFHEMQAIRKACNSIQQNYMPRVTFIVVQKRHHTRLFPANHGDRGATDKSGNILPGTLVDTQICHPTEFDFYLCSHAGIQISLLPSVSSDFLLYALLLLLALRLSPQILYDENNFSADGLQTLTNSLCYTYARCTRSVSIVPPAYYAHLAAFRARYYIEGTEYSDSGSTADGAGTATRERSREVRPLPTIKDNVKDVMFYI